MGIVDGINVYVWGIVCFVLSFSVVRFCHGIGFWDSSGFKFKEYIQITVYHAAHL